MMTLTSQRAKQALIDAYMDVLRKGDRLNIVGAVDFASALLSKRRIQLETFCSFFDSSVLGLAESMFSLQSH